MKKIIACVFCVCLLISCACCSAEICEDVVADWIPSARVLVHPKCGWDYYNDTIYGPKEVVYTKDGGGNSLYTYSQLFWDLNMYEHYLDGWGIYSPERGYVPTQAQRENCYIAVMKDGSTVILPGSDFSKTHNEVLYYDKERDAIIDIVAGTPYSVEEADKLLRAQYDNCGVFTEEEYQNMIATGLPATKTASSATSVPLGDNSVSMSALGILFCVALAAVIFFHCKQRALRK